MPLSRSICCLAAVATLALGAGLPQVTPLVAAEQAIAPEHNPPGDIPDNQVFIAYAGHGFSMQVPEGWTRQDLPDGARFSDKYNIIEVKAAGASEAPSVQTATSDEVAALVANGRAVELTGVKSVTLDHQPAIRIDYLSNSEPNSVTGRQIRLEHARYLFFKSGTLVRLDMAAPEGADNVDQWLLMAKSVRLD